MIRVIDFETTGKEPDMRIVEVGWCDLYEDHWHSVNGNWVIDAAVCELCNPGVPISPETSAVHHIIDEDVADARDAGLVLKEMLDCPFETILAAHNADFEKALFNWGDRQWIDTYKVAALLYREAPSHRLQVLRYWLRLDVDRVIASTAHRAGPDAYVTAVLLEQLLADMSVEEMVRISAEPVFLPRLSFGKHATVPIEEVPADYLQWILDKGGFDEDVTHTARTELQKRNKR